MTAMYIALEGPDGVGKSTVAKALRARFAPHSIVRIQHFPTEHTAQRNRLTAEDYARDMEDWLDAAQRTPAATAYILDRWAPSCAVYASLRNEPVSKNTADRLDWLNRVPLATFVLLPSDPGELTDPDYPDPDGYDPRRVTAAYRAFLGTQRKTELFTPITVDGPAEDVARTIAERIRTWTWTWIM